MAQYQKLSLDPDKIKSTPLPLSQVCYQSTLALWKFNHTLIRTSLYLVQLQAFTLIHTKVRVSKFYLVIEQKGRFVVVIVFFLKITLYHIVDALIQLCDTK